MKAALHGIRDIGAEHGNQSTNRRHLKTYIRPSHSGGGVRKTLKSKPLFLIINNVIILVVSAESRNNQRHEERKAVRITGNKRGRRD